MQLFSPASASGPDDSWCRRLGNFPAPGWAGPAAPLGAIPRVAVRAAHARETHTLRTHILQAALGVATAAALMVSPAGSTQGMGGGMGHGSHGHSGQEHTPSSRPADAPAAHVPNPLRAMVGEMLKLRGELLLTSTQIEPWSLMEDALRDSVELGRSHAQAPAPNAAGASNPQLFVQDLADSEHALADALARLSTTMKSALAVLTPRQSKLVQERFAAAIQAEAPGSLH